MTDDVFTGTVLGPRAWVLIIRCLGRALRFPDRSCDDLIDALAVELQHARRWR